MPPWAIDPVQAQALHGTSGVPAMSCEKLPLACEPRPRLATVSEMGPSVDVAAQAVTLHRAS